MNEQTESTLPKEVKPLPFTTLYHVLPEEAWLKVQIEGLHAKRDLTNVWGVFMLEPDNFLTHWRGKDRRLLRSIKGPYVLLEITVTPETMKYIKIRSIPELRRAIRELVKEGVISGYFAEPFPERVPYKGGRYEQINGWSYEEYARHHLETPNFREPVEIFSYDEIPPEQIKLAGRFTNVHELRKIIQEKHTNNSLNTQKI